MIIRGILDKSLSKQTCIRGFARIKELARISKANPEYQRELIDKHIAKTSNFLTEETYLFFPEVILSAKLKYDYTKVGAKKGPSPITLIETKKLFKSNVDGLSIRTFEKKNSKAFDVGGRNEVKIVELEFDEGLLLQLIERNEHPLHRVDGNHRLSSAEQLNGDRINQMDVPFCIVLFEELTQERFNPEKNAMEIYTDRSFEKFERVVFYNINSKSEPLTLEQNLRVIIDDKVNFSSEDIEKIFPTTGIKIRELVSRIDFNFFTGIKHLLNNNFRNLSKTIFESLRDENQETIVEKVIDSLKAVEQLYITEETLKDNKSEGLFTTFLYYNIRDKVKYSFFKEWVLKNHIFDIEEVRYQTLIQIFDKIAESTIKIFVAMPYFSDDEVNEYNLTYNRVIDKIKEQSPLINIALYPIMQHKGETYNINNKMIEQINEASIVIADISNRNINVAFELGYARSAKKPTIMVKREDDTIRTPFDYEQDMCHTYNSKAHQTLVNVVYENVKEELLKRGFIFKN